MWRIIIGSFLSSRYMGLLLLLPRIVRNSDVIEDTADGGGLTIFWEHDCLHAQTFETLMILLFEDIYISI